MKSLPIENVQNYPRPPALELVEQRIIIRHAGELIAQSDRAYRVMETHHAPTYYLPVDDILATLNPVSGNTFCEWKGVARYFDLITQQGSVSRAAWTYENPTQTFTPIAGYIAFYAGKVDEAWVGDVKVIPQPGDFYGGWVTPNLEGRIKGAPGTNHW
ncbi:DUF427 domain-containing protein [Nitrincola schmidtii]|uniref:DUF427 domain-containing protein n=1 Tax=Nitrincola schmidtii TaxID=1730894 RepID=UPI00124C7232|nr:DUF427 domain-containing protein [Nitrincola schmidtii]